MNDTIVAIASAPGGAPRGIVRISGPKMVDSLATCFTPRANSSSIRKLRQATRIIGDFTAEGFAASVPCDLFVWPGVKSYTREPIAEIHTIGSPPLLDAVLATLCRCGARLAEPGEFTLRAFLSGRLDLTQAEAVLGVIDADNQRGLDTALVQLAGGLSRPLAALREELLDLLSRLEAGLDFADEDIEFISQNELSTGLWAIRSRVEGIRKQMQSRSQSRQLPGVVLTGLPNAGKSSLFNMLAPQSEALVSDLPGTTRDYLTAKIEVDNFAFNLVDTAGWNFSQSIDSQAEAAHSITEKLVRDCDLCVFCWDVELPMAGDVWLRFVLETDVPMVVLVTKIDKRDNHIIARAICEMKTLVRPSTEVIGVSSRTGIGLKNALGAMRRSLIDLGHDESSVVVGTAVRCGESLRLTAEALQNAITLCDESAGEEIVASELRVALDELGIVAGVVYTDDILDRIFSRFCIGK